MVVAVCVTFFLALLISPSHEFGFQRGDPQPLYNFKDRGIVSLNVTDFKVNVLGSDRAWLVEFYSSYCGHCVHFAPTYKEFSEEVYPWRNVLGVAAIDCANDNNMPTCREYDIMGYPSMKFFPPKSAKTEIGEPWEGRKEVGDMVNAVGDYIEKIANNASHAEATVKWPDLKSASSLASLNDLWTRSDSLASAPVAVVMYGQVGRQDILKSLLSFTEVTSKLSKPVILKRIYHTDASEKVKEQLKVGSDGTTTRLFAITKEPFEVKELSAEVSSPKVEDFVKSVRTFVWENSKTFVGPSGDGHFMLGKEDKKQEHEKVDISHLKNGNQDHDEVLVHSESEIKRRRYTAFHADLENAVLYSLSHEVAQHNSITGEALNALQDYISILVKFFPGRAKTRTFLAALRAWILNHDDAIQGEDLASEINVLKAQFGAFKDLGLLKWIGCKGTEPKFGGYPCALWMLWHTLTIAQVEQAAGGHSKVVNEEPYEVLAAMTGYVEHFFGCRECARHFLQEAENGLVFEKQVKKAEDSALWLWKTHNRVNYRLSGDLTDDKAFPKEKFPNRQHCSDCYNGQTGSDNWSEFRRDRVLVFLRGIYAAEHLDFQDLTDRDVTVGHHTDHHDVGFPLIKDEQGPEKIHDRNVDKKNYDRHENLSENGLGAFFFSKSDAGLFFFVYLISGLMLLGCYFKFVRKLARIQRRQKRQSQSDLEAEMRSSTIERGLK